MSRRTIAAVMRWAQYGRPRGNVEPGFIAPHRLKGVIGAPKPGWYPDPAGAPGLYRWWDGGNWAQVTSDSAQAPPPIPLLSEAPSGGAASLRRASPLRVAAVLSVGFALFLSASIGIGLVLWQDPSDSSAQRALGGAAGRSSPAGVGTAPIGHLDERTRTATIGPASLTMPGDPYVLSPDPMEIPGVLDLLFWTSAPVHIRYDGKHDWSSGVLLGRVSEASDPGDLRTEGTLALHRLSQAIFDQHPTELRGLTWQQHMVSGRPAMRFSAEVHYAVDRLPSRYDTVTAVLVRLGDGSLIMAASSVPNDADPDIAQQAGDALRTLTIR